MASLPPYSTYRTDSKVSRSFAGRTQNVLLAKVPALGECLASDTRGEFIFTLEGTRVDRKALYPSLCIRAGRL